MSSPGKPGAAKAKRGSVPSILDSRFRGNDNKGGLAIPKQMFLASAEVFGMAKLSTSLLMGMGGAKEDEFS